MSWLFGSAAAPEAAPNPADTIERLCDRIISSRLLEDRRNAVRSLKGMAVDHQVEVGNQGMPALMHVLKTDRADSETVNYALEALSLVTAVHKPGDEADVGVMFTEIFVKSQENVSVLLSLLEEPDFHTRINTIKLLTALLTNRSARLQECILAHPLGVSQLMDLLGDEREVVRNESLLLLIELTKSNAAIQKIVAFENAFERLFDVIGSEGLSEGGIIVEDCLRLALNLLHGNDSNMAYFRETSCIARLVPFFQFSADLPWSPQRVANIRLMLKLVRELVSPSNSQAAISGAQAAMRSHKLLDLLGRMALSPALPREMLADMLAAVAESMRGSNPCQDEFAKLAAIAPGAPPVPALVALICITFDSARSFADRCAALYCFQSYLHRHPEGQTQLCQTLLPASSQPGVLSPGALLCQGLCTPRDQVANWFAALAFCHVFAGNRACKDTALRVAVTREAGKTESLVSLCVGLLAASKQGVDTRRRAALLLVLVVWLSDCPPAVRVLLGQPASLSVLTALMVEQDADSNFIVEGLAAVLLGLCIAHNDETDPGTNRAALRAVVQHRVGVDVFARLIDRMMHSDTLARAGKSPQITDERLEQAWLDYDAAALLRAVSQAAKAAVESPSVPPTPSRPPVEDTSEEHQHVVAQYKLLIREQDEKYAKLQEEVKAARAAAESATSAKAEAAALREQLTQAQRAAQQAREALAAAQQQSAALASKDGEAEQLRAQLSGLQAQLAQVAKQNTALAEDQEALRVARADAMELHEQLEREKSAAAEKQAQISALEARLAETQKKLSSLDTEHSDLLVCLAEQDKRLQAYRERLRGLNQEVSDSDDDGEEEAEEAKEEY